MDSFIRHKIMLCLQVLVLALGYCDGKTAWPHLLLTLEILKNLVKCPTQTLNNKLTYFYAALVRLCGVSSKESGYFYKVFDVACQWAEPKFTEYKVDAVSTLLHCELFII